MVETIVKEDLTYDSRMDPTYHWTLRKEGEGVGRAL